MENRPLGVLTFVTVSVMAVLISACDGRDPFKPKTELAQNRAEHRTMIIGGVPVHDKDYKLTETLLVEDVHLTK